MSHPYNSEFMIAERRIATDEPTYFIADIAANHDGDLERAKDLIWKCKEAGADAAKFQHFKAEKIVSDYGFKNLGAQQSHQAKWKKSVVETYRDAECGRTWTEELVKTAKEANIHFFTSPYDDEALKLMDPVVPAYKIGSGDITWIKIVEKMAKLGKPVLLATGASSMTDVERAVAAITKHNPNICVMQCNTNYTALPENFKYIQLNVLKAYAEKWPNMVLGLSDHTPGHSTVLGAVALGARMVEKHFTDDNDREGPDHPFSMNPTTWREMVDRTRELEYALGGTTKKVEGNEDQTVVLQRRCLRLTQNLPSGTVLTEAHLEALRPCPENAFEPYWEDMIIGKPLTTDKVAGDSLNKTDVDLPAEVLSNESKALVGV